MTGQEPTAWWRSGRTSSARSEPLDGDPESLAHPPVLEALGSGADRALPTSE